MFVGVPAPLIWIVLSLLSGLLLLLLRSWLTEKQLYYTFLARWIMIPYLGLIGGMLSPTLMGLTNIDRLVSMGLGIGLVFATIGLLILVRLSIPTPTAPQVLEAEFSDAQYASSRQSAFAWSKSMRATLLAGAEEFQWVFLRGALWETLLFWPESMSLPAYTAIWGAAILALPEALLRIGSGWARLLQFVTLVTTSVLFFYTRNFWLCLIVHVAIIQIFRSSQSRQTEARAEQAAP